MGEIEGERNKIRFNSIQFNSHLFLYSGVLTISGIQKKSHNNILMTTGHRGRFEKPRLVVKCLKQKQVK